MTRALRRVAPPLELHQEEAVRRICRILERRCGALLADEPGLGKTWVAAAVAAARVEKGDAIEVVSPAPLRSYWTEVLTAFGVTASVVSHEKLSREQARGKWQAVERLVIVDEAHRFRNPRTRRYEGLARLSVGALVLLVTATPVCNTPEDLVSLLHLIAADDELAARGVASIAVSIAGDAEELGVINEQFVVRRRVDELSSLTPSLRETEITCDSVPGLAGLRRSMQRLTFPWMSARVSRNLIQLILERRLESSVAALAATIRRMTRLCRRARSLAERGASLTASELRSVLGDPEADTFQDILFPACWGAEGEAARLADLDSEIARLGTVATSLPHDPKLAVLKSVVRQRAGTPGLIFTGSYDTALAVFETMSGLVRCALLTGRRCVVRGHRRQIPDVIRALNRGEVDLVIATDVGGEGLNLEAAGYVVHYDQPWNPTVLAQRVGRIRRMGQTRPSVESISLLPPRGRSSRIIERKSRAIEGLWRRFDELSLVTTELAAWQFPAVIGAEQCQARMVSGLRRRGLCSGELAELLSRRYRVGIERWIENHCDGFVSREEIELLREILRAEAAMLSRGRRAI